MPKQLKKEEDYSGKIAYRTDSRTHHFIKQESKKRRLSLSKTLDALIIEGIERMEHESKQSSLGSQNPS